MNDRETARDDGVSYKSLDLQSLSAEHICCALSGGKHEDGVAAKKDWLAGQFAEGLVFRKADVRGKVFIEYAPGETSWRPIHAPGYLVIHCLWVSGRFKDHGHGHELLESCIADAAGKAGVAVVSKKTPFLTEPSFYARHGFECVDRTKSGYELLVYRTNGRTNASAADPTFCAPAKAETIGNRPGLVVQAALQCPFVPRVLEDLIAAGSARGLSVEVDMLTTRADIEHAGSPFGTFGIFLNGDLISHELASRGGFDKLLDKALKR